MVTAFDEAVRRAVNRLDYSYYDMAVITRTGDNLVSSIEIDYAKLNILRAEISKSVHEILCKKSNNTFYIPLGSLLGNEYTAGYGPDIKFKMQFTDISRLDFESSFYSAGINNVLHQINIKADLSYSIIMHGADETFSVGMTAVAAQTVIAGAIPENFTNVVETPDSNVADDIFNFAN
ncbi:MAG: sporulation protein YunB [Clostridia bacterium]|nr:sporulation protein YunB [Clostridia bacterium]